MQTTTTYTVNSSNGTFIADEQGHILERDLIRDAPVEYTRITQFDFVEWLEYWRNQACQLHGEHPELPGMFDILDLGYWYATDDEQRTIEYETPVAEHRAEVVKPNMNTMVLKS